MRKVIFANGEYYHVYNRGVDKRDIFLDEGDFTRFLTSVREFNKVDPIGSLYEKYLRDKKIDANGSSTPTVGVELPLIVDIIAYCLNPNHYHLILKQTADNGIGKFMHKLNTGYTNYFNGKQERSGALFQGRYKAVHIDSNEYLLYLSAYVNCNSEVHGICNTDDYKWCSLSEYVNNKKGICKKNSILSQFGSLKEYKEYAKINAKGMKDKKKMEKLLLE